MSWLPSFLKTLFRGRTDQAGDGSRGVVLQPDNMETDFRILAENSSDLICRISPDMGLVYASPSVEGAFGWTPQEMKDVGPGGFLDPRDMAVVEEIHNRLVSGEDDVSKVRFRVLRKDGASVWVESNARLIRDPVTGAPGDIVVIIRDISEHKQLEEQLLALSLTDELTGLGNRRAFDEALEREWRRTMREGSQMSLLLLDLDHFKNFNDLYGHQAGDDCLRVVSSVIRQAVQRPGDVAARYGGEELAVILADTDTEGAEQLAEAIRIGIEGLALRHAGNEGYSRVTASVGVATAFARMGGRIKMPEGLLLAVDQALYKAKRNGRNRVVSTVLLAAHGDGAEA